MRMKTVDFTAAAILVVLVFYLLNVGQPLLLPLVIAISLWYLINTLAHAFNRVAVGRWRLPMPLCILAAFLSFSLGIWALVNYFGARVPEVQAALPEYQANLLQRLANMSPENLPFLNELRGPGEIGDWMLNVFSEWIDLPALAANIVTSFGSILGSGVLILIYMLFLFLEQGNFSSKLSALVASRSKEKDVRRIIDQVRDDIRKYISIKMFTSTLTGLLSYIFLLAVGVDFAGVWGLLIFLLNFIPTVGSIVATIFPAMIALAQADDYVLLLTVLAGIGSLQVMIGNILEPRMMGSSFNLSPVIILLNLALWGYIWGVAGMFLCVPFLIIITIVLSHFPRTRPLAVILSKDGQLQAASPSLIRARLQPRSRVKSKTRVKARASQKKGKRA